PVLRRGDGECAQALALGRRVVERPRQGGERASRRRALDVLARKQAHDLVPERARLPRAALVGRRLADEVEPPRRARAGGVEEVAVALDRAGAEQATAEPAARRVVEERGFPLSARQAALLQAEQEDDLEPSRA